MHVMISYNWASQKTVRMIRERLREEGFKVWIDIENMCKLRAGVFLRS